LTTEQMCCIIYLQQFCCIVSDRFRYRLWLSVPERLSHRKGGIYVEFDTVRLVYSCPGCGFDIWVGNEDGSFRCLSCGDEFSPKNMVLLVEPISYSL